MTITNKQRSSISNPSLIISALIVSVIALTPNVAFAHVNAGSTHGLIHGLSHPFLGLDHLLAMIAVGLWAAQLGGKATWLVPLSFVSVMCLGGTLGINALQLPFTEIGILASLLILGILIAAAIRLPLLIGATIVGFFALFHGLAHGTEIPANISSITYITGFVLATVMLHLFGVLAATGIKRSGQTQWLRLLGASIAIFGSAQLITG